MYTMFAGGRNRRVAEAFVKTGKSIKELEDELLNGQKLQGPITAEEVNHMLTNKNMENKSVFFSFIIIKYLLKLLSTQVLINYY